MNYKKFVIGIAFLVGVQSCLKAGSGSIKSLQKKLNEAERSFTFNTMNFKPVVASLALQKIVEKHVNVEQNKSFFDRIQGFSLPKQDDDTILLGEYIALQAGDFLKKTHKTTKKFAIATFEGAVAVGATVLSILLW